MLSMKHHVTKLTLLMVWASLIDTASGQCTVCQDAQQVPLPKKILAIPGFPALPCGSVDSTLGFLVPNETSTECEVVQSLGSICGCPTREDGCSLCPNGDMPGFAEKQLPDFMSDMFLGFAPTCEILDAHLRSLGQDESICLISTAFISDYCGCAHFSGDDAADDEQTPNIFENPCSLCPDGSSPSQPDRNITVGGFEFGTCSQFEEALSLFLNAEDEECSLLSQAYASLCGCDVAHDSCSLCRDGSPVVSPDKPLDMFKEQFGGLVPTCEVYESFVAGFSEDSNECSLTRMYGTACGCPPVEDYCEICPGESIPEEFLNKTIQELTLLYEGFTATCFEVEAYLQYQIPEASDQCFLGRHGNFLCGCSNGIFSYLGADTRKKQAVLAWAPRVAAILSLIGSLCIIQDVLRSKKKRSSMYSQLVLGMSVFDLVGAVAWGLNTLMIPADAKGEFSEYIYGAHGNNATCKLQGFMIQLNFTAIFYNISLATYYFLVIVKGWRDRRLKSNRWWLHGAPVSLGVALAFAGLPFYRSAVYACHIQNPPIEETWYPIMFFTFVPIFATIIFTTAMMMRVYFQVRQQSLRAARWKFSAPESIKERFCTSNSVSAAFRGSSSESNEVSSNNLSPKAKRSGNGGGAIGRLQREVFIQSLFYLSAFYLSWAFLLSAILIASPSLRDANVDPLYPFFVTCLFLAPLQGFWNAAVYFRPRLLSRWSKYIRRRSLSSQAAISAASSMGLDTTANESSSLKLRFSWRHRRDTNEKCDGSAQRGEHKTDAVGDITGRDIDAWGEDFDPSNEIAYLTTRSERNTGYSTTDDDASPVCPSADLNAIREELEELEGAQAQIEEFEDDVRQS